MSNFWKNKKVLVTGGAGFAGSHLVEKLVGSEAEVTVLDHFKKGKTENLSKVAKEIKMVTADINDLEQVTKATRGHDIVMNLAAKVGGIEYNRTHQGTMLFNNLMIGSKMIEATRLAGVERFLVVSSACVYPSNASIPTPESEGFMDEPEITNSGYGWSKRMAELLGRFYAEEFGMKVSIVRPYNLYGPRDHFGRESSHVIPALIQRIADGENPLSVWGSGKQTRAFLYVEDVAEGMMLAVEKYPVPDAINLGTDDEISIKDLVAKITTAMDKEVEIRFDTTKPDGTLRRNSHNRKAHDKLGFKAKTTLDEGLKRTVEWFNEHRG